MPATHPPTRRRPRAAAGLLLVLAVLALAAGCGSDDDDGGGTSGATDGGDAAGPVAVDHSQGTTTVEGRPERIVTLGLQWTDAVLAFGVRPVAYVTEPLAGDDGRYPWHRDLLGDAEGLDVSGDLPMERIAALDPDLILVVPYLVDDDADFDTLADIAPTIAGLSDAQVDKWQAQVDAVGQVLGEPARAEEIVAEVDDLMTSTAAALPGLDGKSFALANHVPGDALYVVADPEDGSSVLFQSLGMHLSPTLLEAADGISGRATFSLEQVSLLDADLLVLFNNDGDPRSLVGYDRLPAVVDGSVANLDFVAVVGLNTPTPLSIPYSLETVRPALEAAA